MRPCADHLTRLAAAVLLATAVPGGHARDEGATGPPQAPAEWADLAEAYDRGAGSGGSPVENLTLPIEHYDSGRVRAVLRAEQAALSGEGYIRAMRVRIELFDETGKREGLIVAEQALFHRTERRGYCRGAVTFERQDVEVAGRDLYWSVPQQRVVLIADARVVVNERTRKAGETL